MTSIRSVFLALVSAVAGFAQLPGPALSVDAGAGRASRRDPGFMPGFESFHCDEHGDRQEVLSRTAEQSRARSFLD